MYSADDMLSTMCVQLRAVTLIIFIINVFD